jgi:aldehyde:ferredoxin oxidoreductase
MSYLTAGKILRIDLHDKTITTEPTARYEEKFFGGRGLALKMLYDEVVPGTDALGPDNVLIFAAGALTGTFCPTAARTHIAAKSPISGYAGCCDCGGFWGSELKYAGYDAIVIRGKAEKPVYISIDNEQIEIRDAGELWGKNTLDSQAAIRRELDDPNIQMFCIGPAGEKLIRYATIVHALHYAAARTGLGAVMGSKNLKAVAVRGTKGVKLADPVKYFELCKAAHETIRAVPGIAELSQGGQSRELDVYTETGGMGVANYQRYYNNGAKPLNDFMQTYGIRTLSCFACPISCGLNYAVPGSGAGAMKCTQYAVLYFSECTDPILNFEAAVLCTEAGLDVIQIGNVLAWVMELYDRGIITEKDTDGIAMKWGDGRAAIEMIKKIIAREGIGEILGEHYLTAAGRLGKASEDYFIHNKGLGVQHLDLRVAKGSALAGAVSVRDFMRNSPALEMMTFMVPAGEEREQMQMFADDFALQLAGTAKAANPGEYEGKAAVVKYWEQAGIISDTLGVCKNQGAEAMMPMTPDKYAELYSAGKGVAMTEADLMEAAHRINTLERAFSVREGLTRDEDTLPRRFLQEPAPAPEGPFKGVKIDPVKLEEMKTQYYELQGWDPATGAPTQGTLKKLGLNDVAKDLRNLRRGPKEEKKEAQHR